MKIQRANFQPVMTPYAMQNKKIKNDFQSCDDKNNWLSNNYFYPVIKYSNMPKIFNFQGRKVHIADGGAHADNMRHFIKAINDDADIQMHDIEVNPKNSGIKQLDSAQRTLALLNQRGDLGGEYVAIPILASVPILNIQDQYNAIMGENKVFRPENMKANKQNLLLFLKKLYESPERYRTYIHYMDKCEQGIEYTYGVIQEINKLLKKGAKVYIPSGHPQDQTLKWMANKRGYRPELYHYIATGEDIGGVITQMNSEIKGKNWYDFNLLSLSDANVVGVKGIQGAQDYMFAAYDSCVTDGERGVYNFYPVRLDDRLIGYSYTDTRTNQYPYEEFPANDKIANITKFVGRRCYDVLARRDEVDEIKQCIKDDKPTSFCADKLYNIEDVFSNDEIERNKLRLLGRYTDRTRKLIFDKNQYGKIIFIPCNCEGSSRPSVVSMWGSCFSVFNAISRDINLENNKSLSNPKEQHSDEMRDYIGRARYLIKIQESELALECLNHAILLDKAYKLNRPDWVMAAEPYEMLGDIFYERGKYNSAQDCYNTALNLYSKIICDKEHKSLADIKKDFEEYEKSRQDSLKYDKNMQRYKARTLFGRFFTSEPTLPPNYNNHLKHPKARILNNYVMTIADVYDTIGHICTLKGEYYHAAVCKAAAEDIRNYAPRGDEVLKLRSQNVLYIGDLYNEIEPNSSAFVQG